MIGIRPLGCGGSDDITYWIFDVVIGVDVFGKISSKLHFDFTVDIASYPRVYESQDRANYRYPPKHGQQIRSPV